MSDIIRFDYKDHWQEEEIILDKSNCTDETLGLIIEGGIDLPFVKPHFTSIIITKIIENSVAYHSKRLRLYDLITRVNNIDFTNIQHQEALNILRRSRSKVHLLVRRLSPPIVEEIELEHQGKLGITISGGFGNEYFTSDHGIFITDINKNQKNQQLDIGDRLLQISSTKNTYDLRFVTYEDAKKYIHLACTESQKIKLCVAHTRPINQVFLYRKEILNVQYFSLIGKDKPKTSRQNQYYPFGPKDEGSVPADRINYSRIYHKNPDITTEHPYVNDEMIDAMHNEPHVNNTTNDLIIPFDSDDHQRYENQGKLLGNSSFRNRTIWKPITPLSTLISNDEAERNIQKSNVAQERNLIKNDFRQNRNTQLSKADEETIREANAEKIRREQSRMSQRARMNRENEIGDGHEGLKWTIV